MSKQLWIDGALRILNSITALAWKPSWQSLLSNGTVNWPANNFLTGIVYGTGHSVLSGPSRSHHRPVVLRVGDYYYIRAGNELVSMGLASCHSPFAAPNSS